MIPSVLAKLKRIWNDENSLVFTTALDAIGGLCVLIIWPFASLVLSFPSPEINFLSYTFPLLTVIVADLYDCLGRYHQAHETKVFKLNVRSALDILALIFTFLAPQAKGIRFFEITPFVLLLLNGVLLLKEILTRIITSLSIWAVV